MKTLVDTQTYALSKVPEVTLGFWVIKIFATTLGEVGGKGDIRHVVLTDDADRCFATWTAGKAAQGKCIPAFQRHLLGQVAAGAAARDCEYLAGCELPRATAAYGRHLAMQGVPFGVIARELGHSIRG